MEGFFIRGFIFAFGLKTLDGLKIHSFFVDLSPIDSLFKTANSNKAVNNHILFLADSVASIHGLIVVRGIPVRIQNYSPISTGQVKAKSAHFGCQQAAEYGSISVELFANALSSCNLSITIDPQVLVLIGLHISDNQLEQIKHFF